MSKIDNDAEFRAFVFDSECKSAREWLVTLQARRAAEAADLERYIEDFDRAVATFSEKDRWNTPWEVMSNAVHRAAQAGSNDRLDLAVSYSVRMAQTAPKK